MPEKRPPKRRRGGQPGNRNARKHGAYAASLDPEQVTDYWQARKTGASHQAALFRARLAQALLTDPRNNRVLRELADTLAEHINAESHLVGRDAQLIKTIMRSTVKDLQKKALDTVPFDKSRILILMNDFLDGLKKQ